MSKYQEIAEQLQHNGCDCPCREGVEQEGAALILELARLLRDVEVNISQTDYGSWVADLGEDLVEEIRTQVGVTG